MQLSKIRKRFTAALEDTLKGVLGYGAQSPDEYALMLFYHLGWEDCSQPHFVAGKRTRPLITMLSAASAGGDWRCALPFGAAVELIHNFSLVHDDIQDESPLRHARATVWALWGTDQAINAGDALFAYAHLAVQQAVALPVEARNRALCLLDEACIALTRGQHLDMRFERRDSVTVDEYIQMVGGKTAALIATAAELGALAAGADSERQAHYHAFGRELGLAFQIRDDLLGIWGDAAVTGKSVKTDIETRKKTLPVVYALQHSEELADAYAPVEAGGATTAAIVKLLEACDARGFAETQERVHAEKALAALAAAGPVGAEGEALHDLTLQLLGRAR